MSLKGCNNTLYQSAALAIDIRRVPTLNRNYALLSRLSSLSSKLKLKIFGLERVKRVLPLVTVTFRTEMEKAQRNIPFGKSFLSDILRPALSLVRFMTNVTGVRVHHGFLAHRFDLPCIINSENNCAPDRRTLFFSSLLTISPKSHGNAMGIKHSRYAQRQNRKSQHFYRYTHANKRDIAWALVNKSASIHLSDHHREVHHALQVEVGTWVGQVYLGMLGIKGRPGRITTTHSSILSSHPPEITLTLPQGRETLRHLRPVWGKGKSNLNSRQILESNQHLLAFGETTSTPRQHVAHRENMDVGGIREVAFFFPFPASLLVGFSFFPPPCIPYGSVAFVHPCPKTSKTGMADISAMITHGKLIVRPGPKFPESSSSSQIVEVPFPLPFHLPCFLDIPCLVLTCITGQAMLHQGNQQPRSGRHPDPGDRTNPSDEGSFFFPFCSSHAISQLTVHAGSFAWYSIIERVCNVLQTAFSFTAIGSIDTRVPSALLVRLTGSLSLISTAEDDQSSQTSRWARRVHSQIIESLFSVLALAHGKLFSRTLSRLQLPGQHYAWARHTCCTPAWKPSSY
ncbi:uncharacterized protein CLUP02_08080 [Colletotrichum lupini]|uniref:Uncharacterized protein n=1 Tax=Colletotrichum lupini TaxID=145971 RepID=A0A9Q8SSF9_9PEZI|nr:uncharacterized protein CLUP02_08080 [Colletotrichum lupini]UQC82590.1 hypothetical protein CLUP02_08080 [Colletotrichum lupini]